MSTKLTAPQTAVATLAAQLLDNPSYHQELKTALSALLEMKLEELDNQRAQLLADLGRSETVSAPVKKARKARSSAPKLPAAPVNEELKLKVLEAIKSAGKAGIGFQTLNKDLGFKTAPYTTALKTEDLIDSSGGQGSTKYTFKRIAKSNSAKSNASA